MPKESWRESRGVIRFSRRGKKNTKALRSDIEAIHHAAKGISYRVQQQNKSYCAQNILLAGSFDLIFVESSLGSQTQILSHDGCGLSPIMRAVLYVFPPRLEGQIDIS